MVSSFGQIPSTSFVRLLVRSSVSQRVFHSVTALYALYQREIVPPQETARILAL
jgi:hypothetical protein